MSETYKMEERRLIFDRLTDVNQDLLIDLYGSVEDYLNIVTPDPIEKYIVYYDGVMGQLEPVVNIGRRIGVLIPEGADADEFLYSTFSLYVQLSKSTVADLPTVQTAINMLQTPFLEFAKQYVPESLLKDAFSLYYSQRLTFIMDLYQRG